MVEVFVLYRRGEDFPMLRALRLNPRLNPRRKLRRDALVLYETEVQARKSSGDSTPAGTFWARVAFFDSEIDRAHGELSESAVFHDRDLYKRYRSMVMGGLYAYWTSEEDFDAGKPGTVEYIAAGSGFGPDVLEESANIIGRPLTLGRGWNPAIVLFDRYGGTVRPSGVSTFRSVQHDDARFLPGIWAIKHAASDAFNEGLLSAGILPRYQKDDDRYLEDPSKLRNDED
jgi:hypothetical protein